MMGSKMCTQDFGDRVSPNVGPTGPCLGSSWNSYSFYAGRELRLQLAFWGVNCGPSQEQTDLTGDLRSVTPQEDVLGRHGLFWFTEDEGAAWK